jgi:hypothetical protein
MSNASLETHLFSAGKKELVGINPVADGTAQERDPMEDHWRFCPIPKPKE